MIVNKDIKIPKKASYGLDGPILHWVLFGGTISTVILLIFYIVLPVQSNQQLRIFFIIYLTVGTILGACMMGYMLWSSKIGKIKECERMINDLQLEGTEKVLDIGCGSGALLIAAAKQLTTGKSIGLDYWSQIDQSNNSAERTLTNAAAEGVSDKVEVKDGDARKLPFEDASFDVVISSMAIHNIKNQEERESSLREIIRVLKPGGKVSILDVRITRTYKPILQDNGLINVQLSNRKSFYFGLVRIVTGEKPGVK